MTAFVRVASGQDGSIGGDLSAGRGGINSLVCGLISCGLGRHKAAVWTPWAGTAAIKPAQLLFTISMHLYHRLVIDDVRFRMDAAS